MALIKKKEAAALLCIGETTLERLISAGEIPAYRIGNACVRLEEADVAAYLESCRLQPVSRMPSRKRKDPGPAVCRYVPGMKVV